MKTLQSLLLALIITPYLLFSQDMSEVEITMEKLSDNVYALYGAGGNIGVMVGDDGVFMIDDQFAPLTEKIKAAIAEISDHDVKFVVNTHFHYDHTGGNENLGEGGAIIIAHENVRKRLQSDQFIEYFKNNVAALSEIGWPKISFTRDMTLHINGEDVKIIHTGHAHTDGDAMVYFNKSNVLHMGDVYFNGMFPFVDVPNGGSINGLLKAVSKAIKLSDHETKIIPGHGKVSNKEELISYYTMINTIRDRVADAKHKGQTLEELDIAAIGAGYEKLDGFIPTKAFVSFVWADLENQHKH